MGKVGNRVAPETGAVHRLGTFRRQPSLVVGHLINGESPREAPLLKLSIAASEATLCCVLIVFHDLLNRLDPRLPFGRPSCI